MRYVCPICGYIYDEAVEGVPFESLPDSTPCFSATSYRMDASFASFQWKSGQSGCCQMYRVYVMP